MAKILVAEDDSEIRAVLRRVLKLDGHEFVETKDGQEALDAFQPGAFELILSDVRMPRRDGLSLMKEVRRQDKRVPIILMTAFASMPDALSAVRDGAFDYVAKPFEIADLRETIKRALEASHDEGAIPEEVTEDRWNIIGRSPAVVAVFNAMARVVDSDAPVLIQGESGTGKELVARSLHQSGPRKAAPFLPVNCAALPETLLEGELFGYMKGAFTGADADRAGLIESAHGGTLFLDEIGEMAPALQAKLLRVLEDGEVRRLGSRAGKTVNVRILCATNRDLEQVAESNGFRRDLLYRINTHSITLPPLRHRVGDVSLLFDHFLKTSCARAKRAVPKVGKDVGKHLEAYPWPGNVRELRHAVERALTNSKGNRLTAGDFQFLTPPPDAAPMRTLEEMEKEHIDRVLRHTGGHQSEAAKILGIDRKTLGRKLKKYGIK